jgi:NiFe hydrogenase small subunit HydA
MHTLFWLQAGSCGGDSLALLNAENPSLLDFLTIQDIDLLYHPSLSKISPEHARGVCQAIEQGEQRLDFLCIEGALARGPVGTGGFDTWGGEPKIEIVRRLASHARWVIAIGSCASYGGIPAATPNPTDCCGLQFLREDVQGGAFPPEFRSASGLPVINIAGCPVHPTTVTGTLSWIASGLPLRLDRYNRPEPFYSQMVHQGCSRSEYHEYDIEESVFGGPGCLYYNLGCKGPRARASCNVELWNGVSSKTRVGVPCMACTEPGFPYEQSLFQTEKIGEIPVRLPLGVDRAHYMAYKGLARKAAPPRIEKRRMKP